MTFDSLKNRYWIIAQKLGAPAIYARFATAPQHDGSPHVERIGNEFHYVITERGSEFERRKNRDADELLYWLASDLTFSLASDWEVQHRIQG